MQVTHAAHNSPACHSPFPQYPCTHILASERLDDPWPTARSTTTSEELLHDLHALSHVGSTVGLERELGGTIAQSVEVRVAGNVRLASDHEVVLLARLVAFGLDRWDRLERHFCFDGGEEMGGLDECLHLIYVVYKRG